MRVLPELAELDEFTALVVRTDYGDDTAWRAVVGELTRPWGDDGEYEARVHLVDDPAWADATPDEVVAAVSRDENVSVVFLADGVTMRSPHRALLACDVGAEDVTGLDPVYYRELVDSPPPTEFRSTPAAVHGVQANLGIANMDFHEYADVAADDPDGVLRPS